MQASDNPRGGSSVEPDLVAVQAAVMRWLQEEAGFAQVISINRDGFPVGRTMGAPIEDDWSVTLIQRNTHRRIGQLRRNPKVEIIWQGTPAPGSTNDRPHVYDFDLLAPRVVFLRGVAEFLDEAETLRRFRVQTERLRSRGFIKAPLRDDADVAANLIGVHVRPLQVRCEGFGDGPQSFTWALD